MKLTDLKHDHSLTNLLKVIIFSVLMLTPFFYVATKCLYVVCNKNAYESYYGETINQVEYNEVTNLEQSKNYYVSYANINTYDERNIYISNFNIIDTNLTIPNIEHINRFYTAIGNDNNTIFVRFKYDNSSDTPQYIVGFVNGANTNNYITFTFTSLGDYNNVSYIYYLTYNNYSYLDNVFEYSVNQMAQSQLFTWTQNTGVYTGANAMTTGLGLTSPVIPILISYWFLLTIIYIVIDIVIVCFTTITHMIVKKTN